MSAIRPLFTISILGIVGLVLYMKINETEPVIPPGAMNWDMSGDLDIGNIDIGGTSDIGNFDVAGVSTEFAGQAAEPSISAPPTVTTVAPSYSAAVSDKASAAPSMTAAPAYAPEKPSDVELVEEPQSDLATPSVDTSTVESSTNESSKLPPLPALPAISVEAAAIATEAPVSSTRSFPIENPVTPTDSLEAAAKTIAGQASLFSATRVAVQSALDRGELSQALLLLSDWYGDPSLSAAEATEVQGLLSQLAGSVIYSTEHRLEPPYMVQAGEKLADIAQKHNIPWQLLAKINGIANTDQLQPGQQLKVLRGPFSARIDLGQRKLVLMLDRRYAGEFAVDIEPNSSIEEGYWAVNQKLLTPGNVGMLNTAAAPSEDRSILLTSTKGDANQVTILRGPGPAMDSAGRVIQLKGADVADVYDILSLGSQVMIRR